MCLVAGKAVWSRDLAMPAPPHALPRWMLELAEQVRMVEPGTLLPTGVIVGSAVIEKVTEPETRSHISISVSIELGSR